MGRLAAILLLPPDSIGGIAATSCRAQSATRFEQVANSPRGRPSIHTYRAVCGHPGPGATGARCGRVSYNLAPTPRTAGRCSKWRSLRPDRPDQGNCILKSRYKMARCELSLLMHPGKALAAAPRDPELSGAANSYEGFGILSLHRGVSAPAWRITSARSSARRCNPRTPADLTYGQALSLFISSCDRPRCRAIPTLATRRRLGELWQSTGTWRPHRSHPQEMILKSHYSPSSLTPRCWLCRTCAAGALSTGRASQLAQKVDSIPISRSRVSGRSPGIIALRLVITTDREALGYLDRCSLKMEDWPRRSQNQVFRPSLAMTHISLSVPPPYSNASESDRSTPPGPLDTEERWPSIPTRRQQIRRPRKACVFSPSAVREPNTAGPVKSPASSGASEAKRRRSSQRSREEGVR